MLIYSATATAVVVGGVIGYKAMKMGASGSKTTKYLPEFEEQLPSLSGKVVAVTGSTSGTGLVFAKVAARKGVGTILLLNRPSERVTQAEEAIKKEIPEGSTTKVKSIPCDLQDFESVKNACTIIKSKFQALDVLCNNAGIMAMEDLATKDGYDVQMQTNHLSHFLLTKELFPLLQRAKELRGEARIVNHSSLARRGGLLQSEYFAKNSGGNLGGNGFTGKWNRYHYSKLANVVFTLALADKLKNSGIKSVCAAPGYSSTNLQVTSQGMTALMWTRFVSQSAEDGAMPLLQCAFGMDVQNGDFWEPSHYMNMVGPATKVKLTKECTDEGSQKMLWEASEEACGKFEI